MFVAINTNGESSFDLKIHPKFPLEQAKIAVDNGADGIFLVDYFLKAKYLNMVMLKIRKIYPDLFIGIKYMDTDADKAYNTLPDSCPALWTN